jgi:hypothetical protein
VIPTTSSQQQNPAQPPEKPEGSQQAPPRKKAKRPWPFRGHLALIDAREQWKEVVILITLVLVRLQMLNYVDALDTSKSDRTIELKNALKIIVTESAHYGHYASWLIIALLVLSVLLRRNIPRRWLDIVAGAFISFNLIIHFLKINLLLLTPPGAPSMLLGQIFTYLIFFVLAWGWIFWRFDWVGKENPGTVVEISDRGDSLSTFDYYHASLMALVRRGRPEVCGLNRTGKILVAIHTFMVLDLIGVALGRFYQLITRMI